MSKPVGPYTPVVRAGDWLVVSGQVGAIEGKLVEGGVREQLEQVMTNLRGLLEGAGRVTRRRREDAPCSSPTWATSRTMNEIYMAAFGDHRPARSAVAVAALPIGALVEVEAWAYTGS